MPLPQTNDPDQILKQQGLSYPGTADTAPSTWGGTGSAQVADAAHRVGDPENPLQDAWGLVKGLGEGVGHVAKGYYDLFTDDKARNEWKQGWSELVNRRGMMSDVGGHIWRGIKEDTASHWTDPEGNFDLGYTMWHHPASALFDLAIVKDAASGGAKLYGKMAGGVSRAGLAAEAASKLRPMTMGDKMVQLGERLDKIPLDPLAMAQKAVGASPVGKWMKTQLGFGPAGEHQLYDAKVANEMAEVQGELAAQQRLLYEKKYGPGSWERFDNATMRGSAEDFKALTPEEQDFYHRYRASQGAEAHPALKRDLPDIENELKQREYIPKDTTEVLAKQAAVKEWGEKALTPERLAEAVEKVKSGEWNPVYRQLVHEKGHEYSLIENMMADARNERLGGTGSGTGGQLHERTGMGVYEKDPQIALWKQLEGQAQLSKRMRIKDAITDLGVSRKELGVFKDEASIPAGWKIVPAEAWERMGAAEKRAHGLALEQARLGMGKGEAAQAAFRKLLTDPEMLAPIKSQKIVAAKEWLSNYMRFRMAIPGPMARTYDSIARYWKSWATILRPSYWLNVMGGNGFLAALHGVNPMDAVRFWRNRKFLPPELQAISQLPRPGASIYQKAVNSGRALDSIIHTYVDKGPVFAKEAEALRLQAKALSDVGHKFDVSSSVLADADKWHQMLAETPGAYSKLARDHTVAREQLAKYSIEAMDKEAEVAKATKAAEGFLKKGNVGQDFYEAALKRESLQSELLELKEQNLRNFQREGMYRARRPELQELSEWAERAIEPANELQGSYNRLHPLERTWLSRAIPFYPWTKAMSALAFRLPFLYPKQTFMWNRYSAMMNDLMSHEEHTPTWLRGAIHAGVTEDGSHVFIRPFWDPFRAAEPIQWGGMTLPGITGGLLRHPLLKVAFDGMGGVDSFTMKPWSTDETMVHGGTGEVYKMDPKTGRFERTIAQPPIWKKLWGLFPEAQMIDQLLLPHVQTDKGWIGHPDAVKDASGTPMFPVPFYQRLTKSLLPVSYQTEQQKMMEERKQSKLFKDYIKEIKHMPPEEQQAAIRVLQDASEARR